MYFPMVLLWIAALLSGPSLLRVFRGDGGRDLVASMEMTLGATVAIAAVGVGLSKGDLSPLLAVVSGLVVARVAIRHWQRWVLLSVSIVAMFLYLGASDISGWTGQVAMHGAI